MKNDMLNALLHILINGPKVGSKEFEEVIHASVKAWLAANHGKSVLQSLPAHHWHQWLPVQVM